MTPRYCLLFYNRAVRIGWIAGRAGAQRQVVLDDGTALSYAADRIPFEWEGEALPAAPSPAAPSPAAEPGATPTASAVTAAALAQLAAHLPELERRAATFDLPRLHGELPKDTPQPFAALAARLLGAGADPWPRAALYLALARGARLFRPVPGGFQPREDEEIRSREAQQAEELARERWVAQVGRWRAALDAGRWPRPAEPEASLFTEQLRSLLAHERQSPHWKTLAPALGLSPEQPQEARVRLKRWLETAGAWQGWGAIWLRWGDVAGPFDAELERLAAGLAAEPVRREGRVDYRSVQAFAIDSPGTLDPDDAYAILERDAEGITVAVHIAEPSPELAPGHPLFEEAARRMSSVYSLDAVVPMFPAALSQARFALVAGQERETVTCRFRLTPSGGQLLGIERGLVRVESALTYAQADAMFAEGPDWARLAELCQCLAEHRQAAGAQVAERWEVEIDRSDPAHLKLTRIRRGGPAARLVEELAILYNREAGRYCREQGLPAIYRIQAQPAPQAVGEFSPTPAARFSLRGGRHAGLACDRYVQVTSPIRRFADLVMQRQIVTHVVTGGVAFPAAEQLEGWLREAEARLLTYGKAVRAIEDDWKRRYLAQNPGAVFAGVVRRVEPGRVGQVWLQEVMLAVEARALTAGGAGARGRFRLLEVEPDRQRVLVEQVA
ncbi:MAG: RNB domain-containing ribonuclease [Candidatus Lambdaproteobacteria bacterium]|nr:RNB domain-containing ribonuclease [Candidatus Lambdaproteobacteria bacterium]